MSQRGLYNLDRKYPRYARKREAELARLASTGMAAREQLILSQVPRILQLSRLWYSDWNEQQEFQAEAALQLIRAVDKFDPTRGARLVTYSFWYLRRAKTTVDLRRPDDARNTPPHEALAALCNKDQQDAGLVEWATQAIRGRWGRRNAKIFQQRLNGLEYAAIGERHGVSRQRVYQIWKEAVAYLRTLLPKET